MKLVSLIVLFGLAHGVGGCAAPIPAIALSLTNHALWVTGENSEIAGVRFQVFDLSGRRIFDSGSVSGTTYKWYLNRSDGKPIANGVYRYIVTTQMGRESRTAMGVIAVRR